jgi:hypothetical protein
MVVLAGSAGASGRQSAPLTDCRNDPQLVGPCFDLHGRLFASNGIPLRIWRIGTRRVLSMTEDEEARFPKPLRNLNLFQWNVIGDFTVCPLTNERPGQTQYVCIESVTRYRLRKLF